MLSGIKLFVLFVGATVFHWALAALCAHGGLSVNPILVFVVACGALFKLPLVYTAAFVFGLFLDFFGTKLFGNNAFTFVICACLVCNIAPRFDFDELFPQMVAVFTLTWFAALLNVWLVYVFASANIWPGFWSLLGGALVDAVCAPFVFWWVRKVMGTSPLLRQV